MLAKVFGIRFSGAISQSAPVNCDVVSAVLQCHDGTVSSAAAPQAAINACLI